MNKGKVFLVGGGPGNLDLLTIKAQKLIKECDCLIYDRLVDPSILLQVKDNCECIYVGKRNHHHTLRQEQINELLVEKANQYKKVVRLKGGDVYVFGRGGEEGEHLVKHHIPFEVVPGVSSCMAGLAYAGIPITNRGIASGFEVVTAHSKDDTLADIDFEAMAKTTNTCVFLMGLSSVEIIVDKLLAAGKASDTPIALIASATTYRQKTLVGTLANILDKLEKNPLESPCLIVVGKVIELRNELNFYEKLPLFGKKIWLPRIGDKPLSLEEDLNALGAKVISWQISKVQTRHIELNQILLNKYQYLILPSKHAVISLMENLKENDIDIRSLKGLKICCIGEKTKMTLKEYGLIADLVPNTYNLDSLIDELLPQLKGDEEIIYINGANQVNNSLARLDKKAKVAVYNLYQVIDYPIDRQIINFEAGDYVIINCAKVVDNLIKWFDLALLKELKLISIGPKTTAALEKHNLSVYLEAKKADFDSVLETLLEKEV